MLAIAPILFFSTAALPLATSRRRKHQPQTSARSISPMEFPDSPPDRRPSAFLHRTPAEALTQVTHTTVTLDGHCFSICYPGNADALLDHPATHTAFEQDEYMPYWADLWPSAQMLGRALLQQNWAKKPLTTLEIGCGVGLPGIVALSLGLDVTFSDYDTAALDFVERNARANGFEHFKTLGLDWRVPPQLKVDLLLASDVIYERRNIEPLVQLISTVLTEQGQCLLVDPNRPSQPYFCQALQQANLPYTTTAVIHERSENIPVPGTLFRISRSRENERPV